MLSCKNLSMGREFLVDLSDPDHDKNISGVLLAGGIAGLLWAHSSLYFLVCNALDQEAVQKLNRIKGRPVDQTFASPGSVVEAEEFADLNATLGLQLAAREMREPVSGYVEDLYRRFPLIIEFRAKKSAPKSVTKRETIWIAGHEADEGYAKFLSHVRSLRVREGKSIVLAGTSCNFSGDKTLTVHETEKVIANFRGRIDILSFVPREARPLELPYSASASVISFINQRPKVLREGAVSVSTLEKYIPRLQ